MENKIIKYPIFAFEVDGNERTGIVLVAAKDEKHAYQYIISLSLFKHYKISFHKGVNYIKYETDNDNFTGNIIYKHLIDI